MRRVMILLMLVFSALTMRATDTVHVKQTKVPILIDRADNVLFYLRINAGQSEKMTDLQLRFDDAVNFDEIEAIKLYYGGTEGYQREGNIYYAPVQYVSSHSQGKTRAANPSYSVLVDEHNDVGRTLNFNVDYKLFPSINYFWISLQMKPSTSLL